MKSFIFMKIGQDTGVFKKYPEKINNHIAISEQWLIEMINKNKEKNKIFEEQTNIKFLD